MRKLTQEYVVDYFESQNCELLDHYVNQRTKVKYKCCCGNIAHITFSCFKKGDRCGCGNIKSKIKRKLPFDEIKELFIKEGCLVLSDEYVNSKVPIDYKCKCGNISKISVNSFKNGRRCQLCGFKKLTKPNSAINAKIRKKYRRALSVTLEATGQRKNTKSERLLGYTAKDLRDHILNHPNWEFVKDGEWHLDHIFPIQAFVDHNINDLSVINSLENLRPLDAAENMSKHDKYDLIEFKDWLKSKHHLSI